MLLGHWKNIAELEDSLCLEELEQILKAARDKERREQVFMAALKGIDLDQSEDNNKERFEEVQKRADAILQQKSSFEIEKDDFAGFGIDFEED